MNTVHKSRKANTHNSHNSSNGPNPWLDNNTHVWVHKPSNLTVVNLRDTTEKLELTESNPMLTKLMAALNAKDNACANELATPDISSVESITASMQTSTEKVNNTNKIEEQQKQVEQQERLKQLIAKICIDQSTINESNKTYSIDNINNNNNYYNYSSLFNFISNCKEQSQKTQTAPPTSILTSDNNSNNSNSHINFANITNNVSNSVFSNFCTKLESANTMRSILTEAPPPYVSSVPAHTPSLQIMNNVVNNVNKLQQQLERESEGNMNTSAFTLMQSQKPNNVENINKTAWEEPSTSAEYEFLPGIHMSESIWTQDTYNTNNTNVKDQNVKEEKEECNLINANRQNNEYNILNSTFHKYNMIINGNDTNMKNDNDDHITAKSSNKMNSDTSIPSLTQINSANNANNNAVQDTPDCNNAKSNISNVTDKEFVNAVDNKNYNTILQNFVLNNTSTLKNNDTNNSKETWNENDDDDDDDDDDFNSNINDDNSNTENKEKYNNNSSNYMNAIIDDDDDQNDDLELDLDSNIKDFEEWWLNNQLTYEPSDDEMEINNDKKNDNEQDNEVFELHQEYNKEQKEIALHTNEQQTNVPNEKEENSQENATGSLEVTSLSPPQVMEAKSTSQTLQSTSQLSCETANNTITTTPSISNTSKTIIGSVDGQHVSELLPPPPPPPSYSAHHRFVRPGMPFISSTGGVYNERSNNINNNINAYPLTNLPTFAASSSSTSLTAASSTLSPSLLPFQIKPTVLNINNGANTQPLKTQSIFTAAPPPPPPSSSSSSTLLPPPPPPPPPPPFPLPFSTHGSNNTPVMSSATPLLQTPIPKSNTSTQFAEPPKQQILHQHQIQQEQFPVSPSMPSATSTNMKIQQEEVEKYESQTLNKLIESEQRNAAQKKTPSQASSTPQFPVYTPTINKKIQLPEFTQVGNPTVGAQPPIQIQNLSILPMSSSTPAPGNVLPGATIANPTPNTITNTMSVAAAQNASVPTSYRIMTTTSGQTVLVPAGFTLCEAPMSLATKPSQNASFSTINSYSTCTNATSDAINSKNNLIASNALQQPIQLVNLNTINKLINNNSSSNSDNANKSGNFVSGNTHTLISCNSLPSYTQNLLALQPPQPQQSSQQLQQIVLQTPVSLTNGAIPLTFTTQPNILQSSTLSMPLGSSANQPVMVYSLLPAATSSGSSALLPMQSQFYTAAMPQDGMPTSIPQSTLPKIYLQQQQQQQQQFLPNLQTLLPRKERTELQKHQNALLLNSTVSNTTL